MSYKIINVGVEYNNIYYNSYLVISDKNALIDTVPKECADKLIKNITKYIDIIRLDVLIINHTHSDRSGAIGSLLNINPDIEIIASLAGLNNLEQQLNISFKGTLAKSTMVYVLSDSVSLKFIITHNINWPDSMMTYFIEEKILFSCDAFSFEKGNVKEYFNKNLYTLSEYVKSAMHQLNNIEISKIYTGSGNKILDKSVIRDYMSWCDSQDKKNNNNITIIYKSESGNNRILSEYLLKVLSDFSINLFDVSKTDSDEIYKSMYASKGVIFVTPTEYRNIPKQIGNIIMGIEHYKASDILFAAIGSYGWSGEAPNLINSILKARHFNTYKSPFRVMFTPTNKDLDELENFFDDFIKLINGK